ncbi:hypothetical protein BMS3Bbin16_00750 [archaeon BMS3Bbin16]|nr:hypothetical protein BMS3Bbin16_00750 [archaeon BMS3Bbin16]
MGFLDNAEIQIPCPKCKFSNSVRLKQIKLEETIICSGCKNKIKLVDSEGSTNRGLTKINKSVKDLKKALK